MAFYKSAMGRLKTMDRVTKKLYPKGVKTNPFPLYLDKLKAMNPSLCKCFTMQLWIDTQREITGNGLVIL